MHRQGGIVWLNNGIRNLWRWNNRKCHHHTIRIFLSHLADEQRTHSRPSSSPKRMAQLESLKAIAALSFFPDHIKDRINKLSTFSVMPLGPVVSSPSLTEDKVIRSEDLAVWASPDRVHCSRFLYYDLFHVNVHSIYQENICTVPNQPELPWEHNALQLLRCSTH